MDIKRCPPPDGGTCLNEGLIEELYERIAELETKLRTLERFYSHTFAGTGVRRCAHCGSEGDSAEPPEHTSTCPYYGLPVIDLEAEP